jgi:hypothetical protein
MQLKEEFSSLLGNGFIFHQNHRIRCQIFEKATFSFLSPPDSSNVMIWQCAFLLAEYDGVSSDS